MQTHGWTQDERFQGKVIALPFTLREKCEKGEETKWGYVVKHREYFFTNLDSVAPDSVYRGLIGGSIDSLEQVFDLETARHKGEPEGHAMQTVLVGISGKLASEVGKEDRPADS
jgi:hypothetical protein